jgi:hypothetical protein
VLETARYPTKSLVTRQAAKDTTIWPRLNRDPEAIASGSLFPFEQADCRKCGYLSPLRKLIPLD